MCVYTIYLYFYYRWKRVALCRCRFWFIKDGCSPVVKPRPSSLCYMDWWESHHCQRPIFSPHQFAFKSPPCHSCGHCTFVVNVRKVSCSDCLSGWNLQIHLLRWVTVQSSQSNPGWEGLQEMCGPSSCSEQAQLWVQTRLLRTEKAFLVQHWYKWMQKHCVFCSPPTYFSPRKVIQPFLLKTIILLQVPFPHCLVSWVTKWQDALKSLTCEFLQNNPFLDEKQ